MQNTEPAFLLFLVLFSGYPPPVTFIKCPLEKWSCILNSGTFDIDQLFGAMVTLEIKMEVGEKNILKYPRNKM